MNVIDGRGAKCNRAIRWSADMPHLCKECFAKEFHPAVLIASDQLPVPLTPSAALANDQRAAIVTTARLTQQASEQIARLHDAALQAVVETAATMLKLMPAAASLPPETQALLRSFALAQQQALMQGLQDMLLAVGDRLFAECLSVAQPKGEA